MRVVIDFAKCSGLGMCEVEAPELFEVSDAGKTAFIRQPTEADRGAAQAAVDGCPTRALSIEE